MSDSNIPASLHEQFSKMGKKGIKAITPEARSRGGKKAWQTRLKRAREAERKQNEEATKTPDNNQ